MKDISCLIVTADAAAAEILEDRLRAQTEYNLEIFRANTCYEMTSIARRRRIFVIYVDFILPDGPGLDGLQDILTGDYQPPYPVGVVLLPQGVLEKQALACAQAGAVDVLLKNNFDAFRVQLSLINAVKYGTLLAEAHEQKRRFFLLNKHLSAANEALKGDIYEKNKISIDLNVKLEEEINRRRAFERSLQERLNYIENIVETQKELVYRMRIDGSLTFVNQAYCDFFQVSREALLGGRPFVPYYPDPNERIRMLDKLDELTPQNPSVTGVMNVYSPKDVAVHILEWTAQVFFTPSGVPTEYQLVLHDVSERIKARESVAPEVEDDLFAVFDGTMQGYIMLDNDGVIKAYNRTAETLSRYFLCKKLTVGARWSEVVNPLYAKRIGQKLAIAAEGKRAYLPFLEETREAAIDLLFTPLRPEKNITGVCVSLIENSGREVALEDLRKNELFFNALIENTADILSIIDGQGFILFASPALKSMLGYESADIIGTHISEYLHPEDISEVLETIARLFPIKNAVASVEYRFRHKNGHWVYLESIGKNLLYDYVVNGVVINTREIGERKRQERIIQKALEDKENILRELNHRVKNNLQLIISLLHLAADVGGEPAALRLAEETDSRVRSLWYVYHYLQETQDFSRIDLGRYVEDLSADLFRRYFNYSKLIEIRSHISIAYLPIETALACGMILAELIKNAFKHAFIHQTEGNIDIYLEQKDGQNRLIVQDDGAGLPPDFNIDENVGLGFQLVQSLTNQIGGELFLTPAPGCRIEIVFIDELTPVSNP